MTHTEPKRALFDGFATIGKAVSSGRRIEVLDILANGERSVDRLADQLELTVANTSQHLQVLRQAGLVSSHRRGNSIFYRLAGPQVFEFLRTFRALAATQVADVRRLADAYLGEGDRVERIGRKELARLLKGRHAPLVLDVRPPEEYEAGHLPGAISMPVEDLPKRIRELPKGREVVTYCRGPYCVFAGEAADLLQRRGFRVRRLEDGLPEWQEAAMPVVHSGP